MHCTAVLIYSVVLCCAVVYDCNQAGLGVIVYIVVLLLSMYPDPLLCRRVRHTLYRHHCSIITNESTVLYSSTSTVAQI